MHADQCFKPPSWHSYAFPRHFCVRVLRQSRPRKNEGRREGRVTAAPGALAPERLREGRLTKGTGGDTPAFPARWFDGLCVLLGEPSRLPPSPFAKLFSFAWTWRQDLGAPGPHDFAVRDQCRSSISTLASIASNRACRDVRKTPLLPGGGTEETIRPILYSDKQKYFLQEGLTGFLPARPTRLAKNSPFLPSLDGQISWAW